ncbi:MAG: alanyl-tRNA editing protein [Gammaproteobacteria bacterium]|nr:alanyl-tRNA editing protein [Gammaproteobacteria bacterium]
MTRELFREDSYLKCCEAIVTAVEDGAFCVDQTVFYPLGGGQPGDTGTLHRSNGDTLSIIDCYRHRESNNHLHLCEEGVILPEVGETVTLKLNWERRHRLMRMHSCMHMLCVAVPAPVTGGSIRDGSGRLDFDLPSPPDKEVIQATLNRLVIEDHPMSLMWITDEEMAAQQELVRTMSVTPPMGTGRVRLVKFGDTDLQPCGGTHVSSTAEIGPVRVLSIKKKGKQNRRITVEFA